jgi:hypothetical protein
MLLTTAPPHLLWLSAVLDFLTQKEVLTAHSLTFPFLFTFSHHIIEVMKMLKNKKILFAIGIILAISSFAVWATSASVSWDPSRYAPFSIVPGQSTTTIVTFTNNGQSAINGKKLLLEIRGDVASIVSVTQPNFPTTIKKGESVSVNLSVQTSNDMPIGVIDGSLALLETKPNGTTKDIFKTALPIEITISPFLLPPDPGIEGEATIEGIDIGGGPNGEPNGVRDDIDRWIAFTAPDSEKKRVAMTLSAKAQQDFMIDYLENVGQDPNDEAVIARVRALADSRIKTGYCLLFVYGVRAGFSSDDVSWKTYSTKSRELEALFMDSPDRIRAFWESEKPLEATNGPILEPDQYKQQCLDLGFDPDQLPN